MFGVEEHTVPYRSNRKFLCDRLWAPHNAGVEAICHPEKSVVQWTRDGAYLAGVPRETSGVGITVTQSHTITELHISTPSNELRGESHILHLFLNTDCQGIQFCFYSASRLISSSTHAMHQALSKCETMYQLSGYQNAN